MLRCQIVELLVDTSEYAVHGRLGREFHYQVEQVPIQMIQSEFRLGRFYLLLGFFLVEPPNFVLGVDREWKGGNLVELPLL